MSEDASTRSARREATSAVWLLARPDIGIEQALAAHRALKLATWHVERFITWLDTEE